MIKAELSAEEVVALPSDTEPWPGPELTARPHLHILRQLLCADTPIPSCDRAS